MLKGGQKTMKKKNVDLTEWLYLGLAGLLLIFAIITIIVLLFKL